MKGRDISAPIIPAVPHDAKPGTLKGLFDRVSRHRAADFGKRWIVADFVATNSIPRAEAASLDARKVSSHHRHGAMVHAISKFHTDRGAVHLHDVLDKRPTRRPDKGYKRIGLGLAGALIDNQDGFRRVRVMIRITQIVFRADHREDAESAEIGSVPFTLLDPPSQDGAPARHSYFRVC